jgi:dTDP-4-dehydrorhamnose reductase
MPAVLVLGGDGMLGQAVVRVLMQSPALRVEFTTRRGQSGHQFDLEEGRDHLAALVRDRRVHFIVNCIGVVSARIDPSRPDSVRQAVAANGLFPFDLASVAIDAGARVLHVSSDGVFSGRADVPYVEDTPTDAEDAYGRTKILGEVVAPNVLNVRCSIVGLDPVRRRGLLEWFLAQPCGSTVDGFVDHRWNGVTSRQFGELCAGIIDNGRFESLRNEGAVHHYCPNETLSKYELLTLFREVWRKNVTVRPATSHGGPVHRVLGTTRRTIPEVFGRNRSMRDVLERLRALGDPGRTEDATILELSRARRT